MAHRRANNEGTIFYRENRQEWVAQVSLNGRRLIKYGKTQTVCRDWVKATLAKIDHGLTYAGTQVTLAKFIGTWLEGKEISRRSHTVLQYRQISNQHIIPIIGQMRLQDIQPSHLNHLYRMKKEEGRGARTVQLIHMVMHAVLNQALKEGILGRNPADAVERPKVERMERRVLTETQARQLVLATTETRMGILIYLALMTGMREGELLGLQWSDLDWEKGQLRIQRQLQRVKGKGTILVPPKTKAGLRLIKLGQNTLEKLAEHKNDLALLRKAVGSKWEENNLVFPNMLGKPMAGENMTKEFRKILLANKLPVIRFHDLRHTSISILLDLGTPVNTVQQRAGHSKASVTTDTYGHSLSHSEVEAAERLEELLTPVAVKLLSK
jgi:integrase